MTTNYDSIGDLYRRAKEQPWRTRVEAHSMMQLIGDVRGKRVVDMACGEGFFTRKLKQAGAARAVGIDVSQEMVRLARLHETAEPVGCEYVVEDARAEPSEGGFDLSVSGWLLVYAHDRAELATMCRGIARRLRSGGRFVTLTSNPGVYHFDRRPAYRTYGFDIVVADHAWEGAPIVWTIHLDERTSFDIENYYLPVDALVAALREAGLRDVAVHALTLAPDPAGGDDRAYWDELLRYPPAIMIDGVKA
jgi:SAM-dependent methyltransferase